MSNIETRKCVAELCPLEASIRISGCMLEDHGVDPHEESTRLLTALQYAREQLNCLGPTHNADNQIVCSFEDVATKAVKLVHLGNISDREQQLQKSEEQASQDQQGNYL